MGCCNETQNFCVGRGETFSPIVRWGKKDLVSVAITAISRGTPVQITAPSHGAPDGWPVAAFGVTGMYQINAERYPPQPSDMTPCAVLDTDNVTLPAVSSAFYGTFSGEGSLVYNAPVPLAGMTATMKFWLTPDKSGDPVIILQNGSGIAIDATLCRIIPSLQTEGLSWQQSYFELDLTDTNGVVTRVLSGTLTIEP